MQRIMIVGSPCAGKSTLARALGARLGLPVHHLDRMFWQQGWVAVAEADRKAAVAAVLATRSYIMEGGYKYSYPARIANCDTLIWLDINIMLRAVRMWRRLRDRHRPRPDLPDATAETDPVHLKGLWQRFWAEAETLQARHRHLLTVAPTDTIVVHLRSARDVRRFVRSLGDAHAAVRTK